MKPKKRRFPSRIYRDSWDLDTSFYKWLLPRLKCYREYANGYPDCWYESFEDFIADIDEKIVWVDFLYRCRSSRKDVKITKEEIDVLFDEERNDKYYQGDWRHWLNREPIHVKFGDYEKTYDKDESEYIWKQEILEAVLSSAFGEWFGKVHATLWW